MGRKVKERNWKICQDCSKKHQDKFSEFCLSCRRSKYIFNKKGAAERKLKRVISQSPVDILEFKQDIKFLLWKKSVNRIDSIDCYIVASIYMDTINMPNTYPLDEPLKQAGYMLNELDVVLRTRQENI